MPHNPAILQEGMLTKGISHQLNPSQDSKCSELKPEMLTKNKQRSLSTNNEDSYFFTFHNPKEDKSGIN
jgi:hypothetical protein